MALYKITKDALEKVKETPFNGKNGQTDPLETEEDDPLKLDVKNRVKL